MAGHAFALPRRSRADAALIALAPWLPMLVALAVLALVTVAVTPSMIVVDTWLALVSGREIVEHGLPSHDQLTLLGQGHRWTDQQWLGQLVFYGLWRLGGLGAVAVAGILLPLVAYGLPGLRSTRAGSNAYVLTFLPLAAVAGGMWGLQIRTQSLGLVLDAAVLTLLVADPRAQRRRTLLVLPILALWANVHGSVVLGAACVLVYGLALLVRGGRRRAVPYVLAPACVLASPYALELPRYYRLMLVDPPFKGLVSEWQPTGLEPYYAGFYVLVAIAVVAVARQRSRFEPFELGLLALTSAAAFVAGRNTVWFALAALTVLPCRIGRPRRFEERGAGIAAAGIALLVLAMLAVAAERPARYYTSRGLRASAASAAERAATTTSGPVFADDEHADWLLWRVPSLRGRLAYDSRLELLTRGDLVGLVAVARMRGDVVRVLRRYPLAVVTPARARLLLRAGWGRVVYEDDTTALVRRQAAR